MQTEELNDRDTAMPAASSENAAAEDDVCAAGSAMLDQAHQDRISRRTDSIMQKIWPELHARKPGTPNDDNQKRKLLATFRHEFSSVEENYARYLLAHHIQAGNQLRI